MTTVTLTGDALSAAQFKRRQILARAVGSKAAEAVRNFINSALVRENPLYRLPETLRATIDAACGSADATTLQQKIKTAFASFYGNLSPVLSGKSMQNVSAGAGAGAVKSAKYAVESPEQHSLVGILTTYFEMVEAAEKNPDEAQTATASSMRTFIYTLINEEEHQKIFGACAATLPLECRQIYKALSNLLAAVYTLSLKSEPGQLEISVDRVINKFSVQERLLLLYKLANLALLQAGDSVSHELLAAVRRALRAPGKAVDIKAIESFFAIAKTQIALGEAPASPAKAGPAQGEGVKVELSKTAQSSSQQTKAVQNEIPKLGKPLHTALGAGGASSAEHLATLQKPVAKKNDFEELEEFQLDAPEPIASAESKKTLHKPDVHSFGPLRVILGDLLILAKHKNAVEHISNYYEAVKHLKFVSDIFTDILDACKSPYPVRLEEVISDAFLVHYGPVVARNPIFRS